MFARMSVKVLAMSSDRSWEWANDPIRAVGGRRRYNVDGELLCNDGVSSILSFMKRFGHVVHDARRPAPAGTATRRL